MKPLSTLAAVAVVLLGSATIGGAAPISEVEFNSTLASAQVIPASAFTTPVPATVFNPPGYPTASVSGGTSAPGDVDFFGFTANGGQVLFDIDNDPFQFDSILSLFDSAGTLIAFDDDSGPEDPGTAFRFDSFVGVFTLPGPGTYYIAVSQFPNLPDAINLGTVFPLLARPDSVSGGVAVIGAPVGNSAFAFSPPTGTSGGLPYTLHISVQNPAGQTAPVPEPMMLLLFGAGLTAVAARRRR